MKRPLRIALVAIAALAIAGVIAVAFTPGLSPPDPTVEGTPSRPTFVLGKKLILVNFTLLAWEDGRWSGIWGIGADGDASGVREVHYGVVPPPATPRTNRRSTRRSPRTRSTRSTTRARASAPEAPSGSSRRPACRRSCSSTTRDRQRTSGGSSRAS